jgi:hypothetical protein
MGFEHFARYCNANVLMQDISSGKFYERSFLHFAIAFCDTKLAHCLAETVSDQATGL